MIKQLINLLYLHMSKIMVLKEQGYGICFEAMHECIVASLFCVGEGKILLLRWYLPSAAFVSACINNSIFF